MTSPLLFLHRVRSAAPHAAGAVALRPARLTRLIRLPLLALLAGMCLTGPSLAAPYPAGQPAARAAGDEEAALLRQLKEGGAEARRDALIGLGDKGDSGAVPQVVSALRDDDAAVRQLAEQALWAIWSRSGRPEVDDMLRVGSLLLAQGQADKAVPVFSRVIERAPDFAEGYNKRATAEYQLGEYDASLKDIDEVLKRNPYHFGALSGAGLCLIELGRYEEAIGFFDRALKINPNMQGIVELRDAVQKRIHKPVI
jgi:tetratricopeptide (TPR) repeat protein